METIAQRFAAIESSTDGIRSGVSRVFARSLGSSGDFGASSDVANYYGLSTRQGDGAIFDDSTMANAQRLYRAAMRDHQFAAIRPLAVKVAEQSLKVGLVRSSKSRRKPPSGLMLKSLLDVFDPAPEHVRKAIAADDIEPVDSHPLLDLFESPNQYMTKFALLYCTAYSMEAVGEAVWWCDFEGESKSIWYWPRSWIKPVTVNGVAYARWKIQIPGVPDDFPTIDGKDVINFRYPNPADPTRSHSPTQSQSRAINTDDQIQESQLASMKNAVRPSLAVVVGDVLPNPAGGQMRPELTAEQRKQIIAALRMAYRGAMHNGDPIILDGMISDVKPVFPSPAELDHQGSSALTKSRIYNGYGTSPIVAGQTEGANRASSYVAHEAFYSLRVNPLLTLISEELTRKVGPRFAADGRKLAVWLTRATADDVEITIRQIDSLVKANSIRPSEMRAKFGFPPDEELDRIWLEKLKQSPQQPPAAPAAAGPRAKAVDGSGLWSKSSGGGSGSKSSGKHKPPQSAVANARRVLKWKAQHGDEVKGMTPVGWARARQLASGNPVTLDTVKRISAFNRHRSNFEAAKANRKKDGGKPWKYAGIVAWLGWGGTAGVNWARKITGASDS